MAAPHRVVAAAVAAGARVYPPPKVGRRHGQRHSDALLVRRLVGRQRPRRVIGELVQNSQVGSLDSTAVFTNVVRSLCVHRRTVTCRQLLLPSNFGMPSATAAGKFEHDTEEFSLDL